MIGTILNVAGILGGSLYSLAGRKPLPASTQQTLKFALGALAMFVGLKLTWGNLSGGFFGGTRQLTVALVALILGRLTGRLLRLQKGSNRLGQFAQNRITAANPGQNQPFSDGFLACTVLFCVTPLAWIGAIQDGTSGYWPTLGLKALMDMLAAMAFASMFRWAVPLTIIPLLACQGTITLLSQLLLPYLPPPLLASVNATGGLLVFTVALVIWELKKVELMDYLPSLAFAPLLTWVFSL